MSNLKLNQIVALEKGIKAEATSATNKAYHALQKPQFFSGQDRTYQRRDDEGEEYPPEPVKLQLRAETVLRDLVPKLTRFYDLTATKDAGNQTASVDVIVDGEVLLPQIPVTTCLFLEKQLVDLYTLVSKLPVLDSAENWSVNANGDYVTPPVHTNKTKKVPQTLVKAAATDKHPAQTEVFFEDKVVGTWSTVKISGAMDPQKREKLLEKIRALQTAVKTAREQANMTEVVDRKIGDAVFGYLTW